MVAERGAFPRYLMNAVYDSKKFTVPNATTDKDVKATEGMFAIVPEAHSLLIRTDAPITIKLNSTSNKAIEVDANIPFPFSTLATKNIFISNSSGGPAVVRLLMS